LKNYDATGKVITSSDSGRTILYTYRADGQAATIATPGNIVTTLAQNHVEEDIIIRRCSEPNQKVIQLYDALKYKYAPFKKKKSVVHKSELEEAQLTEQQFFLAD